MSAIPFFTSAARLLSPHGALIISRTKRNNDVEKAIREAASKANLRLCDTLSDEDMNSIHKEWESSLLSCRDVGASKSNTSRKDPQHRISTVPRKAETPFDKHVSVPICSRDKRESSSPTTAVNGGLGYVIERYLQK